jgi:hypothetical protein
MSTWTFELGIDPSWPEWFKEYRRGADAELHERVDACTSGRMTDLEFKAWALESSQRQAEWLDALAPERRAWIEEQEGDEQFAAFADGRKITLVEFLAELGQDR